jgi:hypothetical protein
MCKQAGEPERFEEECEGSYEYQKGATEIMGM